MVLLKYRIFFCIDISHFTYIEENLEPKCLELKVLHLVGWVDVLQHEGGTLPCYCVPEFLFCVPPPLSPALTQLGLMIET